jgi:hypothetical protein
MKNDIATSSVEAGLDFSLNLISDAVATTGERNSNLASSLLNQISAFIRLRYAGELGLALEYLEGIYETVPPDIEFRREQFEKQIEWLHCAMEEDPKKHNKSAHPTAGNVSV